MSKLAFISEIGRTVEGGYLYRFDFTNEPETVWGDYFNVVPTIVVPVLEPDNETICESYKVEYDKHLILATKNGCFSMQDAFDNIIPLGFIDFEEHDLIYYKDKILKFDFAEDKESVLNKFDECLFKINEHIEYNEQELTDDEIIIESDNIVPKESDIIFKEESLKLYVGQEISHQEIKDILFKHGYKKVEIVYNDGEYAIRGSIIDIFPYNSLDPYKIDFQGNIIEKIYSFDTEEPIPIKYFDEITITLNRNYYG